MKTTVTLLSGADATGPDVLLQIPGDYCFAVAGTFGGATIGLEMLGPDGATHIPIEDASGAIALTAAGAMIVSLPEGAYRAVVAGGSGASIFANLRSV